MLHGQYQGDACVKVSLCEAVWDPQICSEAHLFGLSELNELVRDPQLQRKAIDMHAVPP